MTITRIYFSLRFCCLLIVAGVLANSCTKDFATVNTDKNTIATIGEAEIPFLFSGAIAAVPWSDQVAQNLFADQYAQYFSSTAPYFFSDVYSINSEWVQNNFDPMYTRVAPQLQTIMDKKDPGSAEVALANIWWAYAFHRVTDYFGPIPYFNVGQEGPIPYDAQELIYDDFFKRLTAAVTVLQGKTTETPFGSYDLLYGGNVNKWIKFANTLRLRLAVRISNVDPARAKTEAEAAYAAGVFTDSQEDDTFIARNSLETNRLSQMSDWNEFRMSATMESVLKGYDDPRAPEYFIPAKTTGELDGIRNGLSPQEMALPVNSPDANSHVGPRWTSTQYGGIANHLTTPQMVMVAAEAWFLRAEGATLGWNMGGTPQELYEGGITNSMIQWGVTDNVAIQGYINSAATPVAPGDYFNSPAVSDIPVKFSTDANEQKEQIATQKWLALFPDGMEAWADYRRGHYNKLYPIIHSDNPDVTDPSTQYIRRITFLLSERQSNAAVVEDAIDLLGGPDKITTPLWWDTH